MDLFLTRSVQNTATEFEQLKGGRFRLAPIVGNQICKIKSLIQHSEVETKQNTSQVIVAVLTPDAAPRQPVAGAKDRSNIATVPCTGKSTDRPQRVYHTESIYHETEHSVAMTTRSFGVKHEHLQQVEQP